jgi:two-component system, chemotaxis family, chemotaxis protein CheY
LGTVPKNTIIIIMAIKLVIVDDAPFIREVVRHIVNATGIEVVGEAQDGVEAVEIVRSTRPTVVLMDLVMPRKSGIDATREILAESPEVRVVACSTLDQESMVMKALDAGCCNYVVKPFKKDELVKIIKAAAGV